MDSDKSLSLEIDDAGRIVNIMHCYSKDFNRPNNWVAVVGYNSQARGNLDRIFLKSSDADKVYLVDDIKKGAWLEFAGDYFLHSEKKRSRFYARVINRTDEELILEECKKEDIEKCEDLRVMTPLKAYSNGELLKECRRRELI